MSNVVEFSAVEEEPDAARAAPHRRLLLLSRGLTWLFTLFLAAAMLYVLAGIVVVLFFSDHIQMGRSGMAVSFGLHGEVPRAARGLVRMSDLPWRARLVGAFDWLLIAAPFVFIAWHLRALFGLYARGVVFAGENATHLKRIGLWLIACPFANYAADTLFWLAGGADKAGWLHVFQVQALVLGAIVYVIAQVMEFGREIEQEKDSFI
jgi:hypothetical protein